MFHISINDIMWKVPWFIGIPCVFLELFFCVTLDQVVLSFRLAWLNLSVQTTSRLMWPLKKELNIKNIRLFLGAQKPFFAHLLEHKPKQCSKHHSWSTLRCFVFLNGELTNYFGPTKMKISSSLIVVNKLCFQSFLPQQQKTLACHVFFE